MIPTGSIIQNLEVQERRMPSRTWKVDFDQGRVSGMTDGLDAVRQSTYCILGIERFRHVIYSFDYGNELKRLIGQDPLLVRSEIVRLIREALMEDDRISNVENFQMKFSGDTVRVSFRVITDVGSFEEEVELSV